MAKLKENYFYRIHKEKNGRRYLKIWKTINNKDVYVRSCGPADKLNERLNELERLKKKDVPNQ